MDFRIKTLISSMVFLSTTPSAASDVVYAPAFCEPSALTVFVKNKTSEAQRLWTQVRFGSEIQELHHDLDPKSTIKIRGTEFLPAKMAFSLKAWSKNSLQITASCDEGGSTPLSDVTSPAQSHALPSGVQAVKIHVLNLFLKSQTVHLKAFNRYGLVVDEKTVSLNNYYDTETLKWSFKTDVSRIEIAGPERFHSLLFYDSFGTEKPSPAMALKPVELAPAVQNKYFLVSTKDPRPEEAFVVAISDTEMIEIAREQIRNPALEKIIVAGIELGSGGYNRAFLSRDKSPYSWSVNRVDAFADFAHIDCDGSPDLTEERLLQKLEAGGRICFWRYRVVRELTASEVATGKLKP
ncbi:hypothetical protein [Bdellovibrio bacteriovorus]|uniref:BP74-related protein n=1 Tax=Bdellovibrio bacteriovorus TaxID=959 RepID=UPI0035A7231C